MPVTEIHLTGLGRETITKHWQRLDKLRKAAQKWRPKIDPRRGMLPQT